MNANVQREKIAEVPALTPRQANGDQSVQISIDEFKRSVALTLGAKEMAVLESTIIIQKLQSMVEGLQKELAELKAKPGETH